jgi:hypothetical protein
MATATRLYTAEATSSGMKSTVTAAADTTVLGSGIDVAVYVSKTATNKAAIIRTLEAVIQKVTEETSP